MVTCNAIVPQLFWFKRVRHDYPGDLWYVDPDQRGDVVRAFRDHRDFVASRFLPSSWAMYRR
jgi:hypothetical protein